jgi:hypothetical protein
VFKFGTRAGRSALFSLPEFSKQGNQDVDEEKPGNTGHRHHGDESVGRCGPAPAAIAAVIGEQ